MIQKNQGKFIELLRWLCDHNKDIEVVTLKTTIDNLKLIAPEISKYIVNSIDKLKVWMQL